MTNSLFADYVKAIQSFYDDKDKSCQSTIPVTQNGENTTAESINGAVRGTINKAINLEKRLGARQSESTFGENRDVPDCAFIESKEPRLTPKKKAKPTHGEDEDSESFAE